MDGKHSQDTASALLLYENNCRCFSGKYLRLLIVAAVFCLFPFLAEAGGPVQGARQAGMGTAFVAVADDLSAIAINPAGLVQSKNTRIYGGVTALMPTTTYERPSGIEETTKAQTFLAPNLFIASDFNQPDMAFGIGLFSLYGIGGRKWSETGQTRYLSTESTIGTLVVNPTFSWRVWPSVSIGLGIDYLYALNRAERMVDQSAMGGSDGKFEIEADGTGWGYNVGILISPAKAFQIGLAYRSSIRVEQRGTAELNNIATPLQPLFGGETFRTDFTTRLKFPERLTLGLALHPRERLTLSMEVEWIRWSRFDRQDVNFDKEVPLAGFTDLSVDLNWHDTWLVKFGSEYEISDQWALRAGYAFVQSPVPEETLSPTSPDADSHNFSIGTGYRIGRINLDAFYMAAFFEKIEVNNNILSGTYSNFTHYIGLGIGYAF